MAWLFIPVCSGSFVAYFGEKTFAKLAYLLEILIGAFFAFNWALWALLERYILSPEFILRAATYTIKASCFESKTTIANSFFFINSICPMVKSTSLVV